MTTQTNPAHTPTFVPPMEYDGKFTVSYNLNDGSSSAFRVIPEVGFLIVKACNLHEELVSLCKESRSLLLRTTLQDRKDTALCNKLGDALARAEGKE